MALEVPRIITRFQGYAVVYLESKYHVFALKPNTEKLGAMLTREGFLTEGEAKQCLWDIVESDWNRKG